MRCIILLPYYIELRRTLCSLLRMSSLRRVSAMAGRPLRARCMSKRLDFLVAAILEPDVYHPKYDILPIASWVHAGNTDVRGPYVHDVPVHYG